MIPNTGIKEVHTPVGPNGDIAIAMRFDEEDGLVFGRALIPHVCGMASRVKYKTLSIPAKGSRAKAIVDTGCGHDLIPKNRAKKLGLKTEESDNPMCDKHK